MGNLSLIALTMQRPPSYEDGDHVGSHHELIRNSTDATSYS